jgi:hypothetical protein
MTMVLLRSAGDDDSSPQEGLGILKRLKHAAIRQLTPSSDADLIRFADIFLSDPVRELCDIFDVRGTRGAARAT